MGKELEKEKTVIIDDPMTPVPLNQRQHWTAPAFIFGGLEFSVTLLMIGSTLIGAFGLKGIIPVVLFTFICLTWVYKFSLQPQNTRLVHTSQYAFAKKHCRMPIFGTAHKLPT